jgi:hypothetical protein
MISKVVVLTVYWTTPVRQTRWVYELNREEHTKGTKGTEGQYWEASGCTEKWTYHVGTDGMFYAYVIFEKELSY